MGWVAMPTTAPSIGVRTTDRPVLGAFLWLLSGGHRQQPTHDIVKRSSPVAGTWALPERCAVRTSGGTFNLVVDVSSDLQNLPSYIRFFAVSELEGDHQRFERIFRT